MTAKEAGLAGLDDNAVLALSPHRKNFALMT
jgi:hypothetical protein